MARHPPTDPPTHAITRARHGNRRRYRRVPHHTAGRAQLLPARWTLTLHVDLSNFRINRRERTHDSPVCMPPTACFQGELLQS